MNSVPLTLAHWCIFVACLLPLFCAGVAKAVKSQKNDPYDNANPRDWFARQSEWRARANAAQANSFEALPFFIAAVLVAHQAGAYQARLDILAFLFVVLRLAYIMAYVSGIANVRTVVWSLAFAINIAIFFVR